MRPVRVEVTEVVDEGGGIKTLRFDNEFDVAAGSYGMFWVYGVDEIPMSYSYPDGITVRGVGEATEAMAGMEEGDSMGMRGPFGSSFDVPEDDLLIVGGGTGMAPVALLTEEAAENGADVTVLIGADTEERLVFEDRLTGSADVRVATEDGSRGYEGLVTGLLDDVLDEMEPSNIAACGPEPMMSGVVERFRGRAGDVQCSLERYMKCGVGICGSCCIDDSGSPVCTEGPVYRATELRGGEFGLYHRDAAGRKVYFR